MSEPCPYYKESDYGCSLQTDGACDYPRRMNQCHIRALAAERDEWKRQAEYLEDLLGKYEGWLDDARAALRNAEAERDEAILQAALAAAAKAVV